MTSYIYISIENDNKQQSMKERKKIFCCLFEEGKKKIVKNFLLIFVCLSLSLSLLGRNNPSQKESIN